MKLRWTLMLVFSLVFLGFVLWFRPAGPPIGKMVPEGTMLVASFSNPAETMELLDRSGVFTQIAETYDLKLKPNQVQLAMAAFNLAVIMGKHPATGDRFLVFALDYGPTIRFFSLKERPGLYRAGELLCFSESACAKKMGRYMLAGTQKDLESYIGALDAGLLDDPAVVASLSRFFGRGRVALFVTDVAPLSEVFKRASDLDISLLVDFESFAGVGLAGELDESGLHLAGELFSRGGGRVLKLDPTRKLKLVDPVRTQASLSFRLESTQLFKELFARALGVGGGGRGALAQMQQMVIDSFVGTLSGSVAAAVSQDGSSWALELSRPEEMRSYLALVKRSMTGESELASDYIELVLPDGERTVVSKGDWLVIGSDRDAAATLLGQLEQADTGGPYALWASFWIPGIATDGPAMVYLHGEGANLVEGYVPKAMVETLPTAPEIARAKRYKLVARIVYLSVLAIALALVGLSVYKLARLARPRRERRPSSRTA